MTDKKTTGRMVLSFVRKEVVFGILWAFLIALIGIIGFDYLTASRAPEWEVRILWAVVTVALAAIAIGAMVIAPIWLVKRIQKEKRIQKDSWMHNEQWYGE